MNYAFQSVVTSSCQDDQSLNNQDLAENSAQTKGPFAEIERILNRPDIFRTAKDKHHLDLFISINPFFKEIAEQYDRDVAKGFLKNSRITELPAHSRICHTDQDIQGCILCLDGKLGLFKKVTSLQREQDKDRDIYQQFSLLAKLQSNATLNKGNPNSNKFASKRKFIRRSSFMLEQVALESVTSGAHYHVNEGELFCTIPKDKEIGMKERITHQKYVFDVGTLEQSVIMFIPFHEIFQCINQSLKKRAQETLDHIRKLSCFQQFSDKQLQRLVPFLSRKRRAKGQVIFKEQTPVESVFFISQGEAKIVKQANIAIQNPNNLYAHRSDLIELSKFQQKKLKPLEYADLTKLYGYMPIRKSVELGTVEAFSMLGQEEIVGSRTLRESSAIISSSTCVLYELKLEKLETNFPQTYESFIKLLPSFSKNKILHRQELLSKNLNIQNKIQLDGFYINENCSSRNPAATRRLKIQKISPRIVSSHRQQHSSRSYIQNRFRLSNPQFSPDYEKTYGLNSSSLISFGSQQLSLISKEGSQKASLKVLEFNTPKFNSFNFHRVADRTSLSKTKKVRVQEMSTAPNSELNRQVQKQRTSMLLEGMPKEYNKFDCHNWSREKQVVKKQVDIQKKMTPSIQNICLTSPLIDIEMLRSQRKKELDLNKAIRNPKLSLPPVKAAQGKKSISNSKHKRRKSSDLPK